MHLPRYCYYREGPTLTSHTDTRETHVSARWLVATIAMLPPAPPPPFPSAPAHPPFASPHLSKQVQHLILRHKQSLATAFHILAEWGGGEDGAE